jgi:hypothetical protein
LGQACRGVTSTAAGRLFFKLEKCSVNSWERQYKNQRVEGALVLVDLPPVLIQSEQSAYPTT